MAYSENWFYTRTVRNKGRDPGHKSHFRFGNVRTNSYEGLYDMYDEPIYFSKEERKREKKSKLDLSLFRQKYVG